MKKHILAATLLINAALPAFADPQADIDYIVEQTITRELFEGALQAQKPILLRALESSFRSNGVEVSDLDKFLDVMIDEWIDGFTVEMQSSIGEVYKSEFTEMELKAIAEFYRSSGGQALIAKTPAIMQASAELGMKAGPIALKKVKPRMDKRLREEGVTLSKPNALERILDAF